MNASISIERIGHVSVVTFENPPHNHVSAVLLRELADALEALDRDGQSRATLLQSPGRNYCAGADLSSEPAEDDPEAPNPFYIQAVRLFAVEKPVVCAVQGAAVGAGLGLTLVADFRIAGESAKFSANFVKLGFHPGFGITEILPDIVGVQKSSLICLTGRRLDAHTALSWGLVDEVVPDAELFTRAKLLAEELASNAPLAVQATRATFRAGLSERVRARTADEHRKQVRLRQTADFAEGVRAVSERRPGQFVGR